ncbi:DUF2268 domain-containing protein [Streptococcus mutans]|uniref:DUF2268 domain-containing protein n=1 Tax=Streptococcus mutans TaxID=1309 RepID=UPI000314EF1A|nr:DUF2268 domain-containing protein [Streptococcus mutans]
MTIRIIHSDKIYRELLKMPVAKRRAYFKEQVLAPFKPKFYKQNIPYEAKQADGFDIMMLLSWMHLMPETLTDQHQAFIDCLDDGFWKRCDQAIQDSLARFSSFQLPVQDYTFTALLANPAAPMLQINDGYSGDGGIPGYIFLSLVPHLDTLNRVQSALAHEINHNVRYQFIDWDGGSLKEMIVAEGLAENFAVQLYGKEKLGPWVSKTDLETLNQLVKPFLREHLDIRGMQKITAYLYGDKIAAMMDQDGVGMPYCAGYACGYYLVKYYLEKTGQTIEEATFLPASEILAEVDEFWTETTH